MGTRWLTVRTARLTLVVSAALAIQLSWMSQWRPFGQPGDLLLLLTIGSAMVAGPQRGAILGFVVGMAFDAVHPLLPFGLSALVYVLVGYGVGRVRGGLVHANWRTGPVTALVSSATGVVAYVAIGQLLGRNLDGAELWRIVAVTSLLNAVLAPLALRVLRWAEASPTHTYAGAA